MILGIFYVQIMKLFGKAFAWSTGEIPVQTREEIQEKLRNKFQLKYQLKFSEFWSSVGLLKHLKQHWYDCRKNSKIIDLLILKFQGRYFLKTNHKEISGDIPETITLHFTLQSLMK